MKSFSQDLESRQRKVVGKEVGKEVGKKKDQQNHKNYRKPINEES